MAVVSGGRDARLSALGFDVDRQRLARAYKRRRTALTAFRGAAYVVLTAWLLTGFTFTLKAWASAVGGGLVEVAAYAVLLYFVFWLPVVPVELAAGYVLERRYGMSVQRFGSWVRDAAKGLAIGLALSLVAVEVVYALLAATPDWWWLYAWVLATAAAILFTWLGPVVLAPRYYKYEPVADEALAARLRVLADRVGAKVVGVYRMVASAKTTRAFGGLAGIGNTRRIVLSDTLLNRYTPDEVEAVVAHELAHHVHRDIARILAVGAAVSLVGVVAVDRLLRAAAAPLHLAGVADVAGLPFLVATIAAVSVVIGPVLNALSRRREAAADAFALRVTGRPEAFRSTMVKIHDQNLGVADPHRIVELLFHDHPSARKRVESTQRVRRESL